MTDPKEKSELADAPHVPDVPAPESADHQTAEQDDIGKRLQVLLQVLPLLKRLEKEAAEKPVEPPG